MPSKTYQNKILHGKQKGDATTYLLFELEVEFPHWFLSVPNNFSAPEK